MNNKTLHSVSVIYKSHGLISIIAISRYNYNANKTKWYVNTLSFNKTYINVIGCLNVSAY